MMQRFIVFWIHLAVFSLPKFLNWSIIIPEYSSSLPLRVVSQLFVGQFCEFLTPFFAFIQFSCAFKVASETFWSTRFLFNLCISFLVWSYSSFFPLHCFKFFIFLDGRGGIEIGVSKSRDSFKVTLEICNKYMLLLA
jgi:hypothetical protein